MAHVPAERCLAIIELLAEDACARALGDIAEALGLPKSGAHRLLTTLCELGWAEQDIETSFYRLTMRLATLGQKFYVATGIPDVCQPVLDRLARESREFARLAVVDGHSLVWVAHAQGATSGLVYQPSLASNTVPLSVTASGKAWLATFGLDRAIECVEANGGFAQTDRFGPNAISSVDGFLRELKATKRRGYGLAISEAEPGVTAIAAAIRAGVQGSALGTVSVAGPSVRMTDERVATLAPLVVRCASELSELWHLRRVGRPLTTAGGIAVAA
jgi:IclR family transcriptional regulator, acetate operon repressor